MHDNSILLSFISRYTLFLYSDRISVWSIFNMTPIPQLPKACGVKERISAHLFLENWFTQLCVIRYFVTYFNFDIYYVFRVSTFLRKKLRIGQHGEPFTPPCILNYILFQSFSFVLWLCLLPNYALLITVLIIKYSELKNRVWWMVCI
jgi:hypothetical protein